MQWRFAPTSSSSAKGSGLCGRGSVGYTAANAVRRTPGSRGIARAATSSSAPVLPAETSACARPSATARAATASEVSGRSAACAGCSSIATAPGAWSTSMRAAFAPSRASAGSSRRASPTSNTRMSVLRESDAAARSGASGAKSPPIASNAMVRVLCPPRFMRAGYHGARAARGATRRDDGRRSVRAGSPR